MKEGLEFVGCYVNVDGPGVSSLEEVGDPERKALLSECAYSVFEWRLWI